MALDQPLTEVAIRAAIETNWLGHALYVFERVGSTNTVLARLAEEGAPTGTMVIAEHQAEGRGRQERRWEAPAGSSLLLSLLFRPRWPARQAHWFTMLAGLAAATAIEARSSLRAALKWPNDVMIWDERYGEPQWRKAGGILLETQFDRERLTRVVLGIGLNVNIPGAGLPAGATLATSLLAAGGRPLARIPILTRLLQELESYYEEADAGISPQPAWNERLITRDQIVRVTTANEVIQGQALGSDEWGRLIVRTSDGEIRRFSAGDVTLR